MFHNLAIIMHSKRLPLWAWRILMNVLKLFSYLGYNELFTMFKLSQQFKVQMCCQLNALATIHNIQDLVMAHWALHVHVQLPKLLQPNQKDDNNNQGVHMVKFVDQVLKFSLPSLIRLVDLTNIDKPPIVCHTPHKNRANPFKGFGLDVDLFLCVWLHPWSYHVQLHLHHFL